MGPPRAAFVLVLVLATTMSWTPNGGASPPPEPELVVPGEVWIYAHPDDLDPMSVHLTECIWIPVSSSFIWLSEVGAVVLHPGPGNVAINRWSGQQWSSGTFTGKFCVWHWSEQQVVVTGFGTFTGMLGP